LAEAQIGEGGAARRSRERHRSRMAEAGCPASGGGGGGAGLGFCGGTGLELGGDTSLYSSSPVGGSYSPLLFFFLPFRQLNSYSIGRNFDRGHGHS
jgi:hypothetical protein